MQSTLSTRFSFTRVGPRIPDITIASCELRVTCGMLWMIVGYITEHPLISNSSLLVFYRRTSITCWVLLSIVEYGS